VPATLTANAWAIPVERGTGHEDGRGEDACYHKSRISLFRHGLCRRIHTWHYPGLGVSAPVRCDRFGFARDARYPGGELVCFGLDDAALQRIKRNLATLLMGAVAFALLMLTKWGSRSSPSTSQSKIISLRTGLRRASSGLLPRSLSPFFHCCKEVGDRAFAQFAQIEVNVLCPPTGAATGQSNKLGPTRAMRRPLLPRCDECSF
jgi:hypothetical protein